MEKRLEAAEGLRVEVRKSEGGIPDASMRDAAAIAKAVMSFLRCAAWNGAACTADECSKKAKSLLHCTRTSITFPCLSLPVFAADFC